MGLSVRYYIFPETDPPKRLSHQLVQGLASGKERLPEYAGTRQRILDVILENEDGVPQRISYTQGFFWEFDATGDIGAGLRRSLSEALEGDFKPPPKTGKVVDLGAHRDGMRRTEKNHWQASKEDLDLITADIWPKTRSHRLAVAKTSLPKVTFEAKHALSDASGHFWQISNALSGLTEQGLVGLAYKARQEAEVDDSGPLYRAVAEMADRRLEILRRHRSGKGTWYAYVEVIRWNKVNDVGETVATYHRECDGRKAAVAAGRELLKEHADKVDYDVTVEGRIETDLEWIGAPRASGDD